MMSGHQRRSAEAGGAGQRRARHALPTEATWWKVPGDTEEPVWLSLLPRRPKGYVSHRQAAVPDFLVEGIIQHNFAFGFFHSIITTLGPFSPLLILRARKRDRLCVGEGS